MMPPHDSELSAGDLWAQITATPRPFRNVPFPRAGADGKPLGELAMVVLEQDETIAAGASTEKHVRKVLKEQGAMPQSGEMSAGYADIFNLQLSKEILFRACKRVDNRDKGFFPTVPAIGKLTTDEIGVLMLHYRRVQAEIGPIFSDMSQEEVDAWVERLAKGGSMFPFDSLTLGAQSVLIRSMACQLYASRTDSSSLTTPPDAST